MSRDWDEEEDEGDMFMGLSKEEVSRYSNDPKWRRIRLVIFILFWVAWFAMLVAAVLIIITSEKCPHRPKLKWYQKSVIYDAFVPAFRDTDSDRIGDIKGSCRISFRLDSAWYRMNRPRCSRAADGTSFVRKVIVLCSLCGHLYARCGKNIEIYVVKL